MNENPQPLDIEPITLANGITLNQFPNNEKTHGMGAYGWGFDKGRFRIVMFGSSQTDTPAVRQADAAISPDPDTKEWRSLHPLNTGNNYLSKLQRKRAHADHPPAHVHVFDLLTGRESRYELVERNDGGYTSLKVNPVFKADGTYSKRATDKIWNMISDRHDAEISQLLEDTTPAFIELWRKLYSPKLRSDGFDKAVSRIETHKLSRGDVKVLRRRAGDTQVEIYTPDGKERLFKVTGLQSDNDESGRTR